MQLLYVVVLKGSDGRFPSSFIAISVSTLQWQCGLWDCWSACQTILETAFNIHRPRQDFRVRNLICIYYVQPNAKITHIILYYVEHITASKSYNQSSPVKHRWFLITFAAWPRRWIASLLKKVSHAWSTNLGANFKSPPQKKTAINQSINQSISKEKYSQMIAPQKRLSISEMYSRRLYWLGGGSGGTTPAVWGRWFLASQLRHTSRQSRNHSSNDEEGPLVINRHDGPVMRWWSCQYAKTVDR